MDTSNKETAPGTKYTSIQMSYNSGDSLKYPDAGESVQRRLTSVSIAFLKKPGCAYVGKVHGLQRLTELDHSYDCTIGS